MPNVPTLEEVGVPMKAGYWVGLLAPAKTPPDIVETLSRALQKALSDPATHNRLTDLGFVVDFKNPGEFKDYISER
ncbi:tripartite tricarboxylate transporter substrate-binding protein [Bradyrhizobium sp. CB1717]|uniref:tripartite tricarboxylate transporter substrate-binding protein n=1 Tax=Bradyrhizobium sp. CB1717 TaxID=3039154 RepID=UPI0024B21E84|nr:tripartite tricarboxylate transporter substrate-binding protein [Bradyrhizobium sp. CB1717]WFU23193.1 tripartite tricarboxylate transporter substrate-binding protein [Bradyrhizobium sp. CB1717]